MHFRTAALAFLIAMGMEVMAQDSCVARLDTASVLRIAGAKEPISPSGAWATNPTFDPVRCAWTAVFVTRVGHSNRGRCRHTNGCTVVRQRAIVVDDRRAKVTGRSTRRQVYYNYE